MKCFGATDFDNSSRLITLSAIIISGLHCTLSIGRSDMAVLLYVRVNVRRNTYCCTKCQKGCSCIRRDGSLPSGLPVTTMSLSFFKSRVLVSRKSRYGTPDVAGFSSS